jgi:hypothetical protein
LPVRAIGLGLVALLATVAPTLAQPTYPAGSRIGLTPPKDMTASKRFSGFENAAKAASISMMEMPAEAYSQLAGGLTKEALARQGVTASGRQELTLGGKPAILVSGDQTVGGARLRKWVLALSDPGTTVFIVAQCRFEGGYSDEEMQATLKSVALRAPLSLDEQLAALPFKLGTTAGLRPVRSVAGNALFLTEGPLDVVKEAEQPVLVVASSFTPSPPPGEARERFARAALASGQSVRDIAIERSGPYRLKGQDWHEIVATGTEAASGQPVVVLQTIRFGQNRYLRMVGLTRKDARDRDLPRFRAVIDAVEADDGALK